MKLMRWLFLLMLSSALSAGLSIQSYTLRLQADEHGASKAMATVILSGCASGTLSLPLGFSNPEELRLDASPTGVRLEPGSRNGMTLLQFQFPQGMPAQATLQFSFSVKQVFQVVRLAPGEKSTMPSTSRSFRHAFVNTQEAPIETYRLEFLFPEGRLAQAIREQLPRPKKSEVEPRVLLSKLNGRQAATLQCSGLHQGDATSMVLELVPTGHSFGWLVAGLLLGGLYLFKFRDLVTTKHA